MSPAPHPRMHGLTHVRGGPDPIPGLLQPTLAGSYRSIILAEPSLWALWPMDDPSGDFHNEVDPTQPLTPVDHALHPFVYDLDGPFASEGSAGFSGTDSSVSVDVGTHAEIELSAPDATLIFGTVESFTVEAWIYPTEATGGYIFCEGDTANARCGISLGATGNLRGFRPGTDQIDPGYFPALDEWTHVALTYDGTTLRLYAAGAEIGDVASGSLTNEGLVTFGRQTLSTGTSSYFTGQLSLLALYTDALDAATIAAHAGLEEGSGADPDTVLHSDGAGGSYWDLVGPESIEPGTDGQVLTTTGSTVTWAAAAAPIDDTQIWMPLTTVVGGVPELVWDGDDELIPTLVTT